MALINCPACNKEISDKVKACPNCGYSFVEYNEEQNQVQPIKVTGGILRKGINKKAIVAILSLIAIGLIAFLGFRYFKEQQAQSFYEESFNKYIDNISTFRYFKEQQAQPSYEESYNKYIDNISTLRLLVLDGGDDVESILHLTRDVWNNLANGYLDTDTDKYTRPNGYFVDFNTALSNLFNDSSTISKIQDITDNQTAVQGLMKELQNPPAGLEMYYLITVKQLYTAYQDLTNLAIKIPRSCSTPCGARSLDYFWDSFYSNRDDFNYVYEKFISQIPKKIGTSTDN